MSLNIINPSENLHYKRHTGKELRIAEFFCDTIQGENFVGYPSAFLRLTGCTLNCRFCDSKALWKFGHWYDFPTIFKKMGEVNLIEKLKDGQHLVLTGGSPLLQQANLILFLQEFIERFGFKPYIEIENECTLSVNPKLIPLIDCWNNSPKLENSGESLDRRFNPIVLNQLASFKNSWFKFVITVPEDWLEIQNWFLKQTKIQKSQIVLMPEGANKIQVEANREMVLKLAIDNNVRYSTREHVILWDCKSGV